MFIITSTGPYVVLPILLLMSLKGEQNGTISLITWPCHRFSTLNQRCSDPKTSTDAHIFHSAASGTSETFRHVLHECSIHMGISVDEMVPRHISWQEIVFGRNVFFLKHFLYSQNAFTPSANFTSLLSQKTEVENSFISLHFMA